MVELLTSIWAYQIVHKLLAAVAVIIGYFIIRRYATRHLNKIATKPGPLATERHRFNSLLQAAIRGGLGIITILVVVGILFEGFASALLGVGLLGVAAGFSLQAAIKEYVAGALLLVEGQLHPGMNVCINEKHNGVIERMDLRTTRIKTADGVIVIINSEIKTWQILPDDQTY